jgi:hypothetical protein
MLAKCFSYSCIVHAWLSTLNSDAPALVMPLMPYGNEKTENVENSHKKKSSVGKQVVG